MFYTKANNIYAGDFRDNPKEKAIRTLYRAKRITLDGVRQAVVDKLITAAEYKTVTGKTYA